MGTSTVILSDSIENYNFIEIVYRLEATGSYAAIKNNLICPVEFLKISNFDSSVKVFYALGARDGYNNAYVRPVGYVSNTSIKFSAATRVGTSGSHGDRAIPEYINGLK